MLPFNLVPDKHLLLPDFDGYKLSNSSGIVTSYAKSLLEGLCPKSSKEEYTSYLKTRLDALHNCLFTDTPDINKDSSDGSSCTIYCFNKKGHLLAFDWSPVTHLDAGRVVWQADLSQDAPSTPKLQLKAPHLPIAGAENSDATQDGTVINLFGTLQPTLKFASSNLAVMADGRSKVFVLNTGDRTPQSPHTWHTVHELTLGACEVHDARVVDKPGSSDQEVHVLLVAVVPPSALPVDPPPALSAVPSLHLVTWLTLTSSNNGEYHVTQERLYCGSSALQYCQFDPACSAVVLLTHQLYCAVYNSSGPLTLSEPVGTKKEPLFMFMQTEDDVTVQISAPECSSSSSMSISVTRLDLSIARRDDARAILQGNFLHPVLPDTATWTVDKGRVEVTVCKATPGTKWTRVFQDEQLVGEELLPDEDNNDRLAHLTSDTWGGGCDAEDKPSFNPGQLESCDDADTDLVLQVLEAGDSSASPENSPRALLGNTQYLATLSCSGSPAQFCLRHDVDGLVWRTNDQRSSERFSHTATFNAFGYVKASKTMAKYTSAPHDCSYVCVCDVRSHVYVFCQPLPLGGELKNRRTGRVTSKVARQFLLSLPSHDEIQGLVTLPGLVVVCTREQIFAYALALHEK
ncbi:nudC domain-containing protein 1 isoform X2 [Hyalella azteca]|uniref:NudC domain-containing protein 1 n=1 Tax=Hyalella azteca TaxID=294128 RepID=A0A979FF31_HYAAZ|nr:nudC domain-containing protein 1 isoform X2 [Hyalella azteca]